MDLSFASPVCEIDLLFFFPNGRHFDDLLEGGGGGGGGGRVSCCTGSNGGVGKGGCVRWRGDCVRGGLGEMEGAKVGSWPLLLLLDAARAFVLPLLLV
jgi:hypothetical protein